MDWLDIFANTDLWIFCLRVAIACICGGAIGFERTKRLKEAGIRTHCIIASAAALMMILSKYGFSDLESAGGIFYAGTKGADPSRIASQVVSGISFLGAGVIFRNGKSGNAVKGLTTAAGMWATAAVGMSIGGGLYLLGLVETVLIVIVQVVFHRYSIGYDAYSESEIRIVATETENFRETFTQLLESKRIQVLSLRIERHSESEIIYNFSVRTRHDFKPVDVIELFQNSPSIHSISM